nr:glycosyltransferase family 4 protein [Candidatus Njordarchaeum guaymaensis]
MRVALVCPRYRPFFGGVETHVELLANALVRCSTEVEVLTTDHSRLLPKNEVINGIPVRRFPAIAMSDAYCISFYLLRHLFCLHDVDVVHAHNYGALPVFFAALAKSVRKFPLIITPHFHPVASTPLRNALRRLYFPAGDFSLSGADAVIALTNIERDMLLRTFNLSQSKVIVIPNGILVPPMQPTEPRNNFLLVVSRLEKYKGLEVLFALNSKIRTHLRDAKILVVGEGAARAELDKMSRSAEGVKLLGNLSEEELHHYYRKAAALLSVSSYEAFGMSILEAMAHGCPVIAAAVGAIPEIITDEKTGILVKYPVDINELAEATLRIMTDNSLANHIRTNAYQLVKSKYSMDAILPRILAAYDEVSNYR